MNQTARYIIEQQEFRIRNSHCIYFGIYAFNLTKWRSMDPSEMHVWCNSTHAKQAYDQSRAETGLLVEKYDRMYRYDSRKLKVGHHRHYLAGYMQSSNLIMLVVENEHELQRCGRIETLTRDRPPIWSQRKSRIKAKTSSSNDTTMTTKNTNATKQARKNYTINRFRKNPANESCHNFFEDESKLFFCNSRAASIDGLWSFRFVISSVFFYLITMLFFYC